MALLSWGCGSGGGSSSEIPSSASSESGSATSTPQPFAVPPVTSDRLAELYDPDSGTFSRTGDTVVGRSGSTATALPSGKVLIAGGGGTCTTSIHNCGGTYRNCQIACQNTAELYDPVSGSFATTGELDIGRSRHSATLLRDGRVLIAGGIGTYAIALASSSKPDSGTGVGSTVIIPALKSAELYDPVVGQFSPTGDMGFARAGQAAVALFDGRVLIAGASPFDNRSAEFYDFNAGTFLPSESLLMPRVGNLNFFTITLLSDGHVLVAGGADGFFTSLAEAELSDPWARSFVPAGLMAAARTDHTATLLKSGKVLIAGGRDAHLQNILQSAEIFDPTSGSFTPTGDMTIPRAYHTATLLADGRVLITGGITPIVSVPQSECDSCPSGSRASTASAEIFNPDTGKFSQTGNLLLPRQQHTATLLGDGKVLIVGTGDSPAKGEDEEPPDSVMAARSGSPDRSP